MTRMRWALLWIAAAVAFAAGVWWPLTVETEIAYALSIPLVFPLLGLLLARPPRWLGALGRPPDWLKLGATLVPLEAAMVLLVLSDGSYDGYFLVGIACLPLLLLLLPAAIRDSEEGVGGAGDGGTWGPPGGFDG